MIIDLAEGNSDNDNYETNMPLCDMKIYGSIPERSPITLRVRERVEKIKSETREGLLFDLDDYENPKIMSTKKKSYEKRGRKKLDEELSISGIDLMLPSIHNSSETSMKSRTVFSKGHCSVMNQSANTFSC